MSRRSQNHPEATIQCVGPDQFDALPATRVLLAQISRAKPDAQIVAHRKWANGAWTSRDGTSIIPPARPGESWRVRVLINAGGAVLVACPIRKE